MIDAARARASLLVALAAASLACSRHDGPAPTPAPASAAPAVFTDLATRVKALGGHGEIALAPGTYVLEAVSETDGACPSCSDETWQTDRPAITVGIQLTGEGIRIRGAGSGSTILRTHAGCGVLFDGCKDCAISGVTITDGARDQDDRATDGGLVVRNSTVTATDCVVTDNVGMDFIVQRTFIGVDGVVVREGGVATLEHCRIRRCSWDGAFVARGGSLTMRDVVIDGVDLALGRTMGGGRGVGVRIVTGSRATLEDVFVTRHAGGIEVGEGSTLDARDVVIEASSSFGVLARGSDAAPATLRVQGLVVHRSSACGLAVRGNVQGAVAEARLMLTAQGGPGAGPCAVAAMDVPGTFDVTDAMSWLSVSTAGSPGDATSEEFHRASQELARRLAAEPATSESSFIQDAAGRAH